MEKTTIESLHPVEQIIQRDQRKTSTEALLAIYDELEVATFDLMKGRWRGEEFDTGHFMEGTLQISGWYGKEFASMEEVHPLLYFRDQARTRLFALNPAFASFHPFVLGLMRGKTAHLIVRLLRPIVQTKRYTARLRMLEHRGKVTATMVYDALPIMDSFRKVDEHTLLGIMDMRGMERPYFFVLRRDKTSAGR